MTETSDQQLVFTEDEPQMSIIELGPGTQSAEEIRKLQDKQWGSAYISYVNSWDGKLVLDDDGVVTCPPSPNYDADDEPRALPLMWDALEGLTDTYLYWNDEFTRVCEAQLDIEEDGVRRYEQLCLATVPDMVCKRVLELQELINAAKTSDADGILQDKYYDEFLEMASRKQMKRMYDNEQEDNKRQRLE